MSKVIASELTNAKINSTLNNITTSCDDAKTKINSFINNSNKSLIGGGYDAIRTKLGLYNLVIDRIQIVANNAKSVIPNANNSMLNYLEGNSSLDDSKLPELKRRLEEISSYLSYLRNCQSQKDETGIDYSGAINYWQGIYNELKHLVTLIEGLSAKDASCYALLAALETDAANILRATNSINETTFTKEGIASFKNDNGFIYSWDRYQYIDDSNMSDRAKEWLETLKENWPDNLEPQRQVSMSTALSLLDKGITYSQDRRHAKDKEGNPTQMDCSSYVTYCLVSAGIDINPGGYTGTYVHNERFDYFTDRSLLVPGDVALFNTSTSGGSSNHIGMYLGTNDEGREIWIECSGGGILIDRDSNLSRWQHFYRYNNYNEEDISKEE